MSSQSVTQLPTASPPPLPHVIEPPSPSGLLSSRTVIEYIPDSEASFPGEDYRTSYCERHHDNFDCSDDEDYIDRPV